VMTNLSLLRQNGFNPTGFIYPLNEYRDWTIEIVRKYYNYAFAKRPGQNVGKNYPNINNQAINRVALGSYFDTPPSGFPSDGTSLEYYKARIDEALTQKNWLVFVVHSAETNTTQLQYLRDSILYARSLGIPIVSPKEG